jgi:membrane protein implicated in regulation of membrane protease activity
MSPIDRPAPPAGEEIHLPGPSIQPILLAAAIAVALVGVTTSIILVIAGGVVSIAVIYRWIRDTKRDVDELPLEHD